MPRIGALAAQDDYGDIDWSRMNQSFGTLLDPNPKLYDTKAGPIYQDDINQAIDVGMGASGGGLTTKGIRAYHGSPHDFDRFDLSKIGTGEGAQAYGHGLYFAEKEGVARSYRDALAPQLARDPAFWADKNLPKALTPPENNQLTILGAKMRAHGNLPDDEMQVWRELYGRKRTRDDTIEAMKPKGKMYEVNINADPAHFLDWDKPLNKQAPQVQESLKKAMGANWDEFKHADAATAVKNGFIAPSPEATAANLGVPGIKYLDQGSRGAGQGSSNYVVFNDKLIDILRKYGIAGAAPAGMGALAAQDNYQP